MSEERKAKRETVKWSLRSANGDVIYFEKIDNQFKIFYSEDDENVLFETSDIPTIKEILDEIQNIT